MALTLYATREHFEDAHRVAFELRRQGREAQVRDVRAMTHPPRTKNRWAIYTGPPRRLFRPPAP